MADDDHADSLGALNRIKGILDAEYGFSGWDRVAVLKVSRLHSTPAVTWTK